MITRSREQTIFTSVLVISTPGMDTDVSKPTEREWDTRVPIAVTVTPLTSVAPLVQPAVVPVAEIVSVVLEYSTVSAVNWLLKRLLLKGQMCGSPATVHTDVARTQGGGGSSTSVERAGSNQFSTTTESTRLLG